MIPEHIKPLLSDKYVYNPEKPRSVIKFIEKLIYHHDGKEAGKPVKLMTWQKEMIEKLYGVLRKDGKRRFTQLFLYIPRKNSKSTTAAFIQLYNLLTATPNSQHVIAAGSKEQAGILFSIVKGLVSVSPLLRKNIAVYRNQIEAKHNGATLKIISRESKTSLGMNCATAIVDELLVQPDGLLVEALETSMGTQDEPLLMLLTTASHQRSGYAYEILEYARKIKINPEMDESFLPILYEASESDDWTSPETWKKANPSYGVTVKESFFKQQLQKAIQFPLQQRAFKLFYLNIIQDCSIEEWIPYSELIKSKKPISLQDFTGEPCWVAIDLSSVSDLSAVSIVFHSEGNYYLFNHAFIPAEGLLRREKDSRVPFGLWEEQGYLTRTTANGGKAVDYNAIYNYITNLAEKYNIEAIAYDPWNQCSLINLLEEEFYNKMIKFRQGYTTMSPAVKTTERLFLSDKISYAPNPVFEWCFQNLVLSSDPSGNLKPDKKRAKEKIDLVVTTIMSIAIADGANSVNTDDSPMIFTLS